MIRKIVKIDTEKCNGCGACAQACLENAIGIIDGKAVLLRDDYCDGLETVCQSVRWTLFREAFEERIRRRRNCCL